MTYRVRSEECQQNPEHHGYFHGHRSTSCSEHRHGLGIGLLLFFACCCLTVRKTLHENNDLLEGMWEISCQFHGPLPFQQGIFESTAGKRAIRGLY